MLLNADSLRKKKTVATEKSFDLDRAIPRGSAPIELKCYPRSDGFAGPIEVGVAFIQGVENDIV
jgi:hypothetical protein